MDGKHARRSRNGTPLGQLFDHGCDALSTPICSIVLCTTLQLGATPTLIYALMGSLIPFFMAQLAESRLGVLEHSIGGVLGVTETQIIAILIHISSAFLPMSFWTTAIGTVGPFWILSGRAPAEHPFCIWRAYTIWGLHGFYHNAIIAFGRKIVFGVMRRRCPSMHLSILFCDREHTNLRSTPIHCMGCRNIVGVCYHPANCFQYVKGQL